MSVLPPKGRLWSLFQLSVLLRFMEFVFVEGILFLLFFMTGAFDEAPQHVNKANEYLSFTGVIAVLFFIYMCLSYILFFSVDYFFGLSKKRCVG